MLAQTPADKTRNEPQGHQYKHYVFFRDKAVESPAALPLCSNTRRPAQVLDMNLSGATGLCPTYPCCLGGDVTGFTGPGRRRQLDLN